MSFGVGIIGAGWWAGEHALALKQTNELHLVGFSSRSREKLGEFQRRHGGDRYEDYRRLINRSDVDVVVIATPHHTHAELAIEALQAGKHVLLEKPMACSYAECVAVSEAVRAAKGMFMLGLTHHFISAMMRAKEIVESGSLGPIVTGFCGFAQTWGQARGRPSFYRDRRTGGGVWLTLGVHIIDRLLWLIGTDVVSAHGAIRQRFHGIDEQWADDSGVALIKFSSGAAASLVVDGYKTGPPWSQMRIVGERAVLRLEGQNLSISEGEIWRSVPCEEQNPMVGEWNAFALALRDGTSPPISLDYAMKVMEVLFEVEGLGEPT